MAATAPVLVDCPRCGQPVEVPTHITLDLVPLDPHTVQATVKPDTTPIRAHIDQHLEEAGGE